MHFEATYGIFLLIYVTDFLYPFLYSTLPNDCVTRYKMKHCGYMENIKLKFNHPENSVTIEFKLNIQNSNIIFKFCEATWLQLYSLYLELFFCRVAEVI